MKLGGYKSPYVNLAVDFGYMLLAALVILGYGGYWLDRRLGTGPVLLILGVFLAFATAFQSLLRRLRRLEEAEKAARDRPGAREHNPNDPPR